MDFERIEQNPAFELLSLLSDTGGFMGLFVFTVQRSKNQKILPKNNNGKSPAKSENAEFLSKSCPTYSPPASAQWESKSQLDAGNFVM